MSLGNLWLNLKAAVVILNLSLQSKYKQIYLLTNHGILGKDKDQIQPFGSDGFFRKSRRNSTAKLTKFYLAFDSIYT